MTGALVVALANADAPRRPPYARTRSVQDPLRDAAAATDLLGEALGRFVQTTELPGLRDLRRAVAAIVKAMIDGVAPPLEPLNTIAAEHPAPQQLERGEDGRLRGRVGTDQSSALAVLTGRVVQELTELEPSRLRRCARPECELVFYDSSRSGTQRWHNERPCGLRERQRRHRATRASGLTEPADPTCPPA